MAAALEAAEAPAPISKLDPSPALDQALAKIAAETVAAFAEKGLAEEGLSIAVIDMTGPVPGGSFPAGAWRGDVSYYPCSVVKICYLSYYEARRQSGKLDDTPELSRAVHDMITVSSNDATGFVVDSITGTTSGPELSGLEWERWKAKRNAVNDWYRGRGYTNLNANQKTFCEDAYGREQAFRDGGKNRNRMTAADAARIFKEIVRGEVAGEALTDEMLALLARDITAHEPLEDVELEDARLAGQGLPEGQPRLGQVRRRLRLPPPRRPGRAAERLGLHRGRVHEGREDGSRSHPERVREGRGALRGAAPPVGSMLGARVKAGLVGAGVFGLRATLRIETLHPEHERAVLKRGVPVVYALWHGRLILPTMAHTHESMVTMASRSKDGEIIARWLVRHGYIAARGSTGKGGGTALHEMIECVRAGHTSALTVDGPKGPPRVVQPGILRLARETGAWILPHAYSCTRPLFLRSWDRYLLPKPFSRCVLGYGEPFPIPSTMSDAEALARIAAAVDAITLETDRADGHPPAAPLGPRRLIPVRGSRSSGRGTAGPRPALSAAGSLPSVGGSSPPPRTRERMSPMPVNLKNRSVLEMSDFSREEIRFLLDLSKDLKRAKYAGTEVPRLKGRNLCLIFEKTSTRTRCAFEVAAYDQGMGVTYLDPSGSQIGHKESIKDTARVLGRMYDAIEYRGFKQTVVEELARHAGVPVYNGLTDESHPTQMLADLLTMEEHSDKPLHEVAYCLPRRRAQQHGQLAASRRGPHGHGRAPRRAEVPLARRRRRRPRARAREGRPARSSRSPRTRRRA